MSQVTILGLGPGSFGGLTQQALHALREAELLIGAKRLLDSLPEGLAGMRKEAIVPREIIGLITEAGCFHVAVVMSGDTGFYSGAKKLIALLDSHSVTVLPGLSTVQVLAAKLQKPWQDVNLVSGHGVSCNVVGEILKGKDTFFLTGGDITPGIIARTLTAAGLGNLRLHVAARLSYDDESLISDTAQVLSDREFPPLSAVWVEAMAPRKVFLGGGIADEEFIRADVPMTKQEVRASIAGKLRLQPGDTVYDVGAGTGSVAVELSLLDPMLRVYAVETNADACRLILQNRAKFGAYNLNLIHGAAPAALEALPAPDCAFIGGTKGNLAEILQVLLEKNPKVRVCISAIALETMAQAAVLLQQAPFIDFEVCQISVSRGRSVGSYHLMTAQNPIFLLSARGGADE